VRSLVLILIGLGMAVSGYLLFRHFALVGTQAQLPSDFCSALFGAGCDDTLRSSLAVQLGLPLAGWGLVYYGTLACLLLLGWGVGEGFRFEATTAALLLAVGAALGSIALFITMVTGLAPFCPLCAVVHGINLVILFPLKRLAGRRVGELARATVKGAAYLFGGKPSNPAAARWKMVGFFTTGLMAVVIYQWVYVESALRAAPGEVPFNPAEAIALFESGLKHEIPISEDDPRLGTVGAPIQMVVFGDFQCPGCTKLAHTIPALARQLEGKLEIIFKHFPLDSTCNPLVKKELHPKACLAARAAEAARNQGKFWAFHDEVFMPPSKRAGSLKSLAERLGMDFDRFEADCKGEAGLARIKGDIDLGIRLKVDGTPSVFLNGRRIYDTRPEALRALIAHALEHSNCGKGPDSH
jgi:protein-disulfide isomerase/uncharacterized membrane protein